MKKKSCLVIIALNTLFSLNSNSQNYGQQLYSTGISSMVVSSARSTTLFSTGHVNGIYDGSSLYTKAFWVRKTDGVGQFTSADDFWNYYDVYKDNSCPTSPSTSNLDNCLGIDVIETNDPLTPTSGSRYAMVAACSGPASGYFLAFATLDQSGNVVTNSYYDFPSTTIDATKPFITESATSGFFYVTGSYKTSPNSVVYLYTLKINSAGTITWAQNYSHGINVFDPAGIIESPFNPADLVIAGTVQIDPSLPPQIARGRDGFFMRINSTSGALISFDSYGLSKTMTEHQKFNSITPAFSTNGGSQGYVIGAAAAYGSIFKTWLLKLSPNGSILWSSVTGISGTNLSLNQGSGVLERFSNISNAYTYFCSSNQDNSNFDVYKFDASGSLVPGNSLFRYSAVSTGPFPIYLTAVNQNSAFDGIQIHGTEGTTATDNYYVQAYFDGNSGCNESLTNDITNPGPNSVIPPAITSSSGLTLGTCSTFYINSGQFTEYGLSSLCSALSIPFASNARTVSTNLNDSSQNNLPILIYPNPSDGIVKVETDREVQLKVINQLGQVIEVITLNKENNYKADLSDLAKGVYFVSGKNGTSQVNTKIVVAK